MSNRPESGPMRFGDDWTGLFIRGDNAAYYALLLSHVLAHIENKKSLSEFNDFMTQQYLHDLMDLLMSCNEHSDRKKDPQELKDFTDCLDK